MTSTSLPVRKSDRTKRSSVRLRFPFLGKAAPSSSRRYPTSRSQAHSASSPCASGPSTPTASDAGTFFTFAHTHALEDAVFRLACHQRTYDVALRRLTNLLVDHSTSLTDLTTDQAQLRNTFHNYKIAIDERFDIASSRLDFARVVADLHPCNFERSLAPSPPPVRPDAWVTPPFLPYEPHKAETEDYDGDASPRVSPHFTPTTYFSPFSAAAAVPFGTQRSPTPDLVAVKDEPTTCQLPVRQSHLAVLSG